MRIPHATEERESDENVLPLINVVFLLLIFFMLAGTLMESEPFPVTPPRSASEDPADTDRWTLLLDADGHMALNQEPVTMAKLKHRLEQVLVRREELALQIKADAQLGTTQLIRIMEQLREAGIERLRLLTTLRRE